MKMWKCLNCGKTSSDRPNYCKPCGLVQAGIGTHQKYSILEEYCHQLGLIMRNRNLDHYFIDACAGSGVVQDISTPRYLDGSPLVMAKTKDWVENRIRDKTKPKHVNCVFIEVNPKTFELLERNTSQFSNCRRLRGDCNKVLPKLLDEIESNHWTPFSFIYIDPFGLGDPPIQMETLKRILERNYTELFLQLTIDGLIRVAGHLRYLDSSDPDKRKKAKTYCKTLSLVIGNDRIEEFCKKWPSWREGEREKKALEYYISGLCGYYQHIECVEIPVGSKRPVYYLIYTTRKDVGKKIMKNIIDALRRQGALPLEEYYGTKD